MCGGNHRTEEKLYDKDSSKLCDRLESIRKYHKIEVVESDFSPSWGEPNYVKIRYLDLPVPQKRQTRRVQLV